MSPVFLCIPSRKREAANYEKRLFIQQVIIGTIYATVNLAFYDHQYTTWQLIVVSFYFNGVNSSQDLCKFTKNKSKHYCPCSCQLNGVKRSSSVVNNVVGIALRLNHSQRFCFSVCFLSIEPHLYL